MNSPFRRFSQVYVEIPFSPLSRPRNDTMASIPPSSTSLKENWASDSITHPDVSSSISHKRNLSELDPSLSTVEVVITKKPKHFPKLDAPINVETTTSTEFSNGSTYCHQCRQKRNAEGVIHCTTIVSHTVAAASRCRMRYCIQCLKTRYDENANDITKTPNGHGGYTYKCPKCRDICNCTRCREVKGLRSTGNMNPTSRKATIGGTNGAKSVAPGVQPATKKKAKDIIQTADGTDLPTALAPKPKHRPKAPAKPLPAPKWTKIPTSLSLCDAESRIQIREFVIRFAQLMDVGRGHIEELEEIGGRGKGREGDNKGLCAWVSESCVKAIILGLLGLLADDQVESASKIIRHAIKDIRNSGANLNRIWGILASMRDSLGGSASGSNSFATSRKSSSSDGFVCLTFPDPLPPSVPTTIRQTRNARGSSGIGATIYVTESAQMVPLIEALTETALGATVVREEIEAGIKEGKERMKVLREMVKKENDRWDTERKADKSDTGKSRKKVEREVHKQTLQDLDHALQVVMSAYIPRFGPLGRDSDGRVYWALSPSVVERERASGFIAGSGREIASANIANRSRRGKALGRTREGGGMTEWSWFISAWGKRPSPVPGTERVAIQRHADDDTNHLSSDSNEDEETWWGFWEPEEIRRVAGWIVTSSLAHGDSEKEEASSRRSLSSSELSPDDAVLSENELGVGGRPTTHELKALAKALDEYAGVLEWRVRRQDGDLNEGRDCA